MRRSVAHVITADKLFLSPRKCGVSLIIPNSALPLWSTHHLHNYSLQYFKIINIHGFVNCIITAIHSVDADQKTKTVTLGMTTELY